MIGGLIHYGWQIASRKTPSKASPTVEILRAIL
jgi:hypothetical protein